MRIGSSRSSVSPPNRYSSSFVGSSRPSCVHPFVWLAIPPPGLREAVVESPLPEGDVVALASLVIIVRSPAVGIRRRISVDVSCQDVDMPNIARADRVAKDELLEFL